MCGVVAHSFTSNLIRFRPTFILKGSEEQVDLIWSYDKELIKYLLTYADGEDISDSEYELSYDTYITVTRSGSVAGNDGVYKLLKRYTQNEQYVVADTTHWDANNKEQSMTSEPYGASITISLGPTTCNHTLEHCRQRNNLNRFGGSPGVAGGAYA